MVPIALWFQHHSIRGLCMSGSHSLGRHSLTLPLKLLCWNPSGSPEFGVVVVHEPPVLLARPCNKPFSAPDSGALVGLASLCIAFGNMVSSKKPGNAFPQRRLRWKTSLGWVEEHLARRQKMGKTDGLQKGFLLLVSRALSYTDWLSVWSFRSQTQPTSSYLYCVDRSSFSLWGGSLGKSNSLARKNKQKGRGKVLCCLLKGAEAS